MEILNVLGLCEQDFTRANRVSLNSQKVVHLTQVFESKDVIKVVDQCRELLKIVPSDEVIIYIDQNMGSGRSSESAEERGITFGGVESKLMQGMAEFEKPCLGCLLKPIQCLVQFADLKRI